ncbi:MAG: DUF4625 domain-containing protein [Marinifilaceae bacterium]|jgi:hypothetical protein|nr:DUF4625 domain-containing protein [Marinifilaceae bacterium]
MKTKFFQFLTICLLSVSLFSCDDDNDSAAKPKITITELGHGHDDEFVSNKAIIGEEIHIEAEIIAEGKIDLIIVRIHHEGEDHQNHSKNEDENEWEVDQTFTKFKGLKNTNFHEHIDIDKNAEAGDYHFHIIVRDQEGNETEAEAELELIENHTEETNKN